MALTKEIHNRLDVIDSRDVIARIQELETEVASMLEEARDDARKQAEEAGEEFDAEEWEEIWRDETDEARELKALQALEEEASGSPDWRYGETLIRDTYFREYAEDLADSIGAIDHDARWPLNHIDWEAAADELKSDYTQVEFDGATYWIRA